MAEMEHQLVDSTDIMRKVSQDLKRTTMPVADIEKTLDNAVKQMGSMTGPAKHGSHLPHNYGNAYAFLRFHSRWAKSPVF